MLFVLAQGRHLRSTRGGRSRPSRLRRLLDSWVLALAVALAAHAGLIWGIGYQPVPPPAPLMSFALLPGPPGASGPPGGLAGLDEEIALPAPEAPAEITPPAPEPIDPATTEVTHVLPDRTADRQRVIAAVRQSDRVREVLAGLDDLPEPTAAPVAPWGLGGAAGWTGSGTWSGGSARGDPELARWALAVIGLIREEFQPLPAVVSANPGIHAEYVLEFDPRTGAVVGYAPWTPSGNRSYDGAVERALSGVPTIPLPPPHCRAMIGSRLLVTFEP